MTENLLAAMAEVTVFERAGEDTIKLLAGTGTLQRIKKGRIVFRDKEQISNLYMVVSGFVSLYKINAQGEKKVIFMQGKGTMLNEVILNDMPASISAEVFEDAWILSFHKADFLAAMEKDFDFTRAVIDSMALKLRRMYRQIKNTSGSVRGDKKLAAKLWKLSGDFGREAPGGTTMIELELTITYLADMLGTKRETVSRQLKILTEQGLVYMKDNHFIIPDRDKLAQYFKLS